MSIEDIKRTIPQHLRQAATEYEKGNEIKTLVLIDMAKHAIYSLNILEPEPASAVTEYVEES